VRVTSDSPASKAGLRAGDVIVTADGSELKENMDLVRAINKNKEGVVGSQRHQRQEADFGYRFSGRDKKRSPDYG